MCIHTAQVLSWSLLTLNTLESASMGILGVDKNMDDRLKSSFNPASNELIWKKLLGINYHLVLIDSSNYVMLIFLNRMWIPEFKKLHNLQIW